MSTKGTPFKQRKYYQGTITLFGDVGVGKTQFMNRFNEDSFTDKYEQTFSNISFSFVLSLSSI